MKNKNILSLCFLGLLIGCASKRLQVPSQKLYQNYGVFHDWAKKPDDKKIFEGKRKVAGDETLEERRAPVESELQLAESGGSISELNLENVRRRLDESCVGEKNPNATVIHFPYAHFQDLAYVPFFANAVNSYHFGLIQKALGKPHVFLEGFSTEQYRRQEHLSMGFSDTPESVKEGRLSDSFSDVTVEQIKYLFEPPVLAHIGTGNVILSSRCGHFCGDAQSGGER